MIDVRFALAIILGLSPLPVLAQECALQREAVSIRLADFDSPGEIARPPVGTRLRGIAVLFAGSDIADLDGTIVDDQDKIVSQPLRQVADWLACAGFASIRYNKRYVIGATTADRSRFDRLNGVDLAADGRRALALARSRADLANLPTILVGWSEGTTVAMAVAHDEPSVRAIVLMAPVIKSMAATVGQQYLRVGRPYLTRYAAGGSLDAEAIARADAGPGGVLAHIFVRMFRGFRPGERINPLLDTNKDGRITFAEADPIIAEWYADAPNGGLGMAATGRALPGLAALFDNHAPPVLILQGLNDAMVDPQDATRFAHEARSTNRVTLRRYPGLGHSLGSAKSRFEDALLPIDRKPLDDMAKWLSTIALP